MLTAARATCVAAGLAVYVIAMLTAADGEPAAALVLIAVGLAVWLYGCSDGLAASIESDRRAAEADR